MTRLFLIFIFLVACIAFQPSVVIGQGDIYTFNAYTKLLDNEVFPAIEAYLKIVEPGRLSQKQTKQIADDVFKLIMTYYGESKFLSLLPPTVGVYKMSNDIYDVYVLEVMLPLYDGGISIDGKFVASMLFGKRFRIYIHNKTSESEV